MNQVNMWADKLEVKKGNLGEQLVDQYVRRKGLIPYSPDNKAGAHPFDRMCATPDKRVIVIVDCKAKARRTHYEDTGFDEKHYKQYKYLQEKYRLPVWIFFIDEHQGKIYGNKLKQLEKPYYDDKRNKQYPSREFSQNGESIIYFPLTYMKLVATLTEPDIAQLKKYSQRNYEYPES